MEVIFHETKHLHTFGADISGGGGKIEIDVFLIDSKFSVKIVQKGPVSIQDDPLQCAHSEIFEGDCVLVLGGLHVVVHDTCERLDLIICTELTDRFKFRSKNNVTEGNVGYRKRSDLAFAHSVLLFGGPDRLG